MRLATWNINSVRLRIDLLARLMDEQKPDVICLQETKTLDDTFPLKAVVAKGYKHTHIHGMKSYNGVAILSRVPLSRLTVHDRCGRNDRRHISAVLPNGTELHCIYIPAGGDIPDPKANEKFAHKLAFVDELTDWSKATKRQKKSMILVGDFNIAPYEHDVWSHKQLLDVVSHTPVEVEKLTALRESRDYIDTARAIVPPDRKLYSWWSYRAADWERSDRGRRLDHIWLTPDLAGALKNNRIMRSARGWEPKPSDHVPVIVDLH